MLTKKILTLFLISSFINHSLYAANQLPTITVRASGTPQYSSSPTDVGGWAWQTDQEDLGFDYVNQISLLPKINVIAKADDQTDSDCDKQTSNPIVIANGTKVQKEVDFIVHGSEMPLEFIRYYDSSRPDTTTQQWTSTGKWSHTFNYRLIKDKNEKLIRILPDGTKIKVSKDYSIDVNNFLWYIKLPDGGTEIYTQSGRLYSKYNAHNVGWNLIYDKTVLVGVQQTNGKTMLISMDKNSFNITSVTDPNGNVYKYDYDTSGRMTKVTYPDGNIRTYHYGENGANSKSLTGISINGKRFSNYLYDFTNKANQSGRSDGTQTDKVIYGDNFSIVTNALGAVTRYNYSGNDKTKLVSMERSGVNNCPNSNALTTYDSNGYIASKSDWNGVTVQYERDSSGRVIKEVSGIKNGDYSTALTIKYTWTPYERPFFPYFFSLLTKVEYMKGIGAGSVIKSETYTYDQTPDYYEQITNRIKSLTTCASGSCNVKEYNYTYHSDKTLKSITINDNGKSSLRNFDAAGNLTQFKNPLGHITNYSNYDAMGNVGRVIDANGLITDFGYDARGRVINMKQTLDDNKTRIESYQYGPFGIIQSDINGVRETINYNDNGTISYISHGVGNQVISQKNYIYSNLGVLQKVDYRESNNVRYSKINNHNQLGWTTGDQGNYGQNISYEYDGNGNIVKEIDSQGNITAYSYNSLNNITGKKALMEPCKIMIMILLEIL